jgi:sec-independent protein translocase protein TatA
MTTPILAFGFAPGPMEMAVFGIIALLLFGKRLPDVARSLGKGIVEFKKGVRGIEDEVSTATYANPTSSAPRPTAPEEPETAEVTAPKFEPPKFDTEEEEVTT